MKIRTVKSINTGLDWSSVPAEKLTQCSWSPGPTPEVSVQGVICNGELIIRLCCFAPVVRAVNREADSPVWEDNCLEFFFEYEDGYINLEANANSALRASFGKDRHGRTLLLDTAWPVPRAECRNCGDSWEAVFSVPDFYFAGRKTLRANFYACADGIELPYYASWNPVLTPSPDFHRPEFFGTLELE